MNVSKDLDCSLVSNKNMSEILRCSSLGLGQMKWAKKAQNYSTFHVTYKTSKTQNQKNFFSL